MISIPKLVVLNLTTDCNMRCKYCYASAGDKKTYMSTSTAIKIIKELKEINQGKIKVLFHGGEPLMCFNTIKEIINFCEKNYELSDVDYYIQTNCQLLTEDVIKYLNEKNVKISISIDGCNELTNGCRVLPNGKNSFNSIKHSINLLNKNQVEYNCLAVLNTENYLNVENIIDFFVENKAYNFSFNYFIKGGRGNENSNLALTNEQLFGVTKRIITKLDDYYKKGIKLNEKNVYYLIRSVATKKKLYMCANSPCGAGLNIIGITPDGNIFPCDDLSSQEQFCLGNINEKSLKEILDSPIINYFANCTYKNINECCRCKLSKYCGAGCCSRKFYENDSIYSKDPICGFYKLVIPYVKELLKKNNIDLGVYDL